MQVQKTFMKVRLKTFMHVQKTKTFMQLRLKTFMQVKGGQVAATSPHVATGAKSL